MSWKINRNAIKNIKVALSDGLVDATDVLEKKAKSNAPKDTGALAKSIDSEPIGDLEIRVGTDVKYASSVEYGTIHMTANPFLRPAIKESRDKMLRQFRNKLRK